MKILESKNFIWRVVDVLKKERIRQDITQYRLAKETGLSKTSILRIERHEQSPTAATLYMIAKYLKVRLGEIISNLDE